MLDPNTLLMLLILATAACVMWLGVLGFVIVRVRRQNRDMPEMDGLMDDLTEVRARAARRRHRARQTGSASA